MTVDANQNLALQRAQQEAARKKALEEARKKQAAEAAKQARQAAAKQKLAHEDQESAAKKAAEESAGKGLDKDAFRTTGAGQKSAEELDALYKKYDTDGQDGLSDDEFNAAFDAATGAGGAGETYTVKAGDTLSGIAKEKLGDSSKYTEIHEANKATIGADANQIEVGQELKIPGTAPTPQQIIDSAKLTDYQYGGGSADAADHQAKRVKEENRLTVEGAKSALADMPANDPQRAAYEQKVAALEKGFGEKYPDTSTKPPQEVLDTAAIDPEKPTHSVPDRAEEMTTQARGQDETTLKQAKSALGDLPADDPNRAAYEKKVGELQTAYDKKWNPKAEEAKGSGATSEGGEPPKAGTQDVADELAKNAALKPDSKDYHENLNEALRQLDGENPNADDLKAIAAGFRAIPGNADAKAKAEILDHMREHGDKISGDTKEQVIDALKDNDDNKDDISGAAHDSGGSPEALRLVAMVARYKTEDGKKPYQETADFLDKLSNASPEIRERLAKGLDADGDVEDFEDSLAKAAKTNPPNKADFEALAAYAKVSSKHNEDSPYVDSRFSDNEAEVLKAVVDNFDKLAKHPKLFEHIDNMIKDDDNNSGDLREMGKIAASDPKALEALVAVGKARNANGRDDGDTNAVIKGIEEALKIDDAEVRKSHIDDAG